MRTKFTYFIILFFLILTTDKSLALSWKDAEWKSNGCSKNPFGIWKLRTDANKKPETLIVGKKGFTILIKANTSKKILFKTNHIKNNSFYFELKDEDLPQGNYQSPFLKIRPHKVQTNSGMNFSKGTRTKCFIKVFQYETQKDAYNDKYKSWNIYEITNQN